MRVSYDDNDAHELQHIATGMDGTGRNAGDRLEDPDSPNRAPRARPAASAVVNDATEDELERCADDEPLGRKRSASVGTAPVFWGSASVSLFLNVLALPVAGVTNVMAMRYGIFLGSGLSLAILGFSLFVWLLTGTSYDVGYAFIPLIGCVIGPALMYKGVNGWITLQALHRMGQVDLMVAMCMSLLMIVGVLAVLVYYFVNALTHAM